MKVCLSAPGKTFLLGEYAVLSGGRAFLAATSPRFVMELELGQSGSCQGIHPNSPAGQWIRQSGGLFQSVALRFVDPHSGSGGFGASSAQFLGACVWSQLFEKPMMEWPSEISSQGIWQSFRSVAWDGTGLLPSGADIMAQWMGGLTLFQSQPFGLQSVDWPYEDLSFTLFKTSTKVVTHQHLISISSSMSDMSFSELNPIFDRAITAFHQGVEKTFLEAVNEYSQTLKKMGLIHEKIRPLLEGLFQIPQVLAAKGCGALGADILVVFHRLINRKTVVEQASRWGLLPVGGLESLDRGLRLELDVATFSMDKSGHQSSSFSLSEEKPL